MNSKLKVLIYLLVAFAFCKGLILVFGNFGFVLILLGCSLPFLFRKLTRKTTTHYKVMVPNEDGSYFKFYKMYGSLEEAEKGLQNLADLSQVSPSEFYIEIMTVTGKRKWK